MKTRRWLTASVFVLVGTNLVIACSSDNTNPAAPLDSGSDVITTTPDAEAGGQPDATIDAVADAQLHFGRVDRAGRAATLALLISDPKSDLYNFGDTFTLSGGIDGGVLGTSAELQRSLVNLDLLDGVDDWDGGSPEGSTKLVDAGADADAAVVPTYPHPLVAPLVNDVLIVDTTKPFCTDGYLGVEFQVLTQAKTFTTQTSCGGRWLGDDAIDKTLSLMMKRSLAGVSDNVSQATKPPTLTFPYVAPPN